MVFQCKQLTINCASSRSLKERLDRNLRCQSSACRHHLYFKKCSSNFVISKLDQKKMRCGYTKEISLSPLYLAVTKPLVFKLPIFHPIFLSLFCFINKTGLFQLKANLASNGYSILWKRLKSIGKYLLIYLIHEICKDATHLFHTVFL